MLDLQNLHITSHAEARMRQRGFRNADIKLILSVATPVPGDAFFLRNRDVAYEIERRQRQIKRLERLSGWSALREIERNRHEIQQLERLRGTRLVVEGKVFVTLYQVDRKLRRPHDKKRRRHKRKG